MFRTYYNRVKEKGGKDVMAKMGRPKVAAPRKISAGFRMKEEDYEKLKRFASEHNLTQTEAIEKGLELLYQQYRKAEL